MKNEMLRIRMKSEHLAMIKAAAEHDGVTVTAWVTSRLLRATREEAWTRPERGWEVVDGVPVQPSIVAQPGDRVHTNAGTGVATVQPAPDAASSTGVREPSILDIDRPLPDAEHDLVIELLGNQCMICGDPGDVVKVNVEGPLAPRNLQVLCSSCTADSQPTGRDMRDDADRAQLEKVDPRSDSP